jgi:hypothetical protein
LPTAKKTEFRKIDLMSAGKVSAAIHAILGFLAGLIFASVVGGLLVWMPVVVPATSQIVNVGVVSGAAGLSAIVIFPIVGAILGFLWGVIAAFLYNIVAERIGGIEVETR